MKTRIQKTLYSGYRGSKRVTTINNIGGRWLQWKENYMLNITKEAG